MSAAVTDLPGVPGVPECVLGSDLAARLPSASPPAPWVLRFRAVVWLHHATPAAAELVPAPLRGTHLPFTLGGFIDYLETPVGSYSEVFGSPVILLPKGVPMGTVPFMAVDSLPSLHGGRANWSLPKALATFTRDGEHAARAAGESAAGPWTVAARAKPVGPPLPTWAPVWNRQTTPDGRVLRIGARVRGVARMATVDVETTGPTLPSWLTAGRHVGLVVRRGRIRFGAPKEVA